MGSKDRGPKYHISIRILQKSISGIPLILSLRTRMRDPYVYVVFWSPRRAYTHDHCRQDYPDLQKVPRRMFNPKSRPQPFSSNPDCPADCNSTQILATPTDNSYPVPKKVELHPPKQINKQKESRDKPTPAHVVTQRRPKLRMAASPQPASSRQQRRLNQGVFGLDLNELRGHRGRVASLEGYIWTTY